MSTKEIIERAKIALVELGGYGAIIKLYPLNGEFFDIGFPISFGESKECEAQITGEELKIWLGDGKQNGDKKHRTKRREARQVLSDKEVTKK